MKDFTESDVQESTSWDGAIVCDRADLLDKPLWFHTAGRMQTASGYGKRLKTPYVMRFNGHAHRVYCCCFSNTGTCYIESKGRRIIVDAT